MSVANEGASQAPLTEHASKRCVRNSEGLRSSPELCARTCNPIERPRLRP